MGNYSRELDSLIELLKPWIDCPSAEVEGRVVNEPAIQAAIGEAWYNILSLAGWGGASDTLEIGRMSPKEKI